MRTLFLGLTLAALVLCPACGKKARIVVVEGAEAGTAPILERKEEGKKEDIGLWDASAVDGDMVVGPVTYAYLKPEEGAEPKRGGTVRCALLQDIDSLNPFLSQSSSAHEVQEQIFPRLMNEEPNFYDGVPTFTPKIAESWEIAPDNLSIRFKLRDCNWSDGEPIKADDVRFAWQAAKSPDVAWVGASIVDFIDDIEIHNDREFTVKYTKPTPYNIMDINDVPIIPKHTFGTVPFGKWSGYPDWAKLSIKACGGAWVLEEHLPNQEIRLKPNPEYWDKGKPYLDGLTFVIFGNQESMLNALLAGDIDILSPVRPVKAARVLEDKKLYLFSCVDRSYGYAGWNCKRFPFDDVRVRRAMTLAINRQDIVEGEYYGYGEVAAPALIRALWASDPDIEPMPYDPSQAERLLTEAGWKKGADGILVKDGKRLAFKMMINTGNAQRKSIATRIQSDLAKIGAKVELEVVDYNQMSARLKQHDFESYVGGWNIATKVDPKPTFHSVSANGRYNFVNYTDPFVDSLIDRGRIMNISDPAIRKEAEDVWKAFQQRLHYDQPYTMIVEIRKLTGVNKRLRNVRVSALKWLDNVASWWIE